MALVEIPGEQLALKMWETLTEKGIGGLLTPWQIRREGRAHADVRRHEKLVLAQAEKDAQDILAGRKSLAESGELLEVSAVEPPTTALPGRLYEPRKALVDQGDPSTDLLHAAAERFAAREVQRFVNLQRIAIHAEDQARELGDEGVSDEPVDADWLNRWRENAQDISVEHMQKIWARILAEEFKSPGSYSVRALEFLRTLSKKEAQKIAAVGPYVVSGCNICNDQPFLDSQGILFTDLLELQEMGILSGVEAIGLNWSMGSALPEKFSNVITSYGKALAMERATRDPAMQMQVYRVTQLGREILQLGDYAPNEDYLRHVGAQIKKQGFSVRYGDWHPIDGTTGRVMNAIEL